MHQKHREKLAKEIGAQFDELYKQGPWTAMQQLAYEAFDELRFKQVNSGSSFISDLRKGYLRNPRKVKNNVDQRTRIHGLLDRMRVPKDHNIRAQVNRFYGNNGAEPDSLADLPDLDSQDLKPHRVKESYLERAKLRDAVVSGLRDITSDGYLDAAELYQVLGFEHPYQAVNWLATVRNGRIHGTSQLEDYDKKKGLRRLAVFFRRTGVKKSNPVVRNLSAYDKRFDYDTDAFQGTRDKNVRVFGVGDKKVWQVGEIVRECLKDFMSQNAIRLDHIASRVYQDLGFKDAETASFELSQMKMPYETWAYQAKELKPDLFKLKKVMEAMRIPSDHPVVGLIKEKYGAFSVGSTFTKRISSDEYDEEEDDESEPVREVFDSIGFSLPPGLFLDDPEED